MRLRTGFLAVLASGVLFVSGSCKDVTAPAAVDSLSIGDASLDLVPGETAQLTAVPRDATGTTLERAVTWSSSAPQVATVAGGSVTAVAAGNATVTAAVDGKTATASVNVEDGGLLMPSGGTISAVGGLVLVSVPASAVATRSRLLVRVAGNYPPSVRLLRRSVYELRTNGTLADFAQPLSLTIRYDPADLGTNTEDGLQMFEAVGNTWQPLTDNVVNKVARTVSAKVGRLGVYAILVKARLASLAVAPDASTLRVRERVTFTTLMRDGDGAPLTGPSVDWSSSAADVVQIDAATGAAVALKPGDVTITASSEGISARATVHVTPGQAAQIKAVEGDGQSAAPGQTLPIAPAVVVTDADNNPVEGAAVTFSVRSGGGSITGGAVVTGSTGVARVGNWTLGTTPGANVLAATIAGLEASPVLFSATAIAVPAPPPPPPPPPPAAPPALIAIVAGNGQTAVAGTQVPIKPAVKVTDAAGRPVPGVTVTFSERSGGGTVAGAAAVSDSNGIATVGGWTLGIVGGNSLFATLSGVAGSPLIFIATATSSAPPPPGPPPPPPQTPPAAIAIFAGDGQTAAPGKPVAIAPAVKVTDAAGKPVSGVTVTFSERSGGGTLTGATPLSDINGIATLGSWTLGLPGGNSLFAAVPGVTGSPLIFVATATAAPPPPPPPPPPGTSVRIVTFGDSNTDAGYVGTNPVAVATSYVSSSDPRMPPTGGNSPYQLAGKIELQWQALSSVPITAVNHGISGTGSGTGRTGVGAPNAKETVNGVTRFDGEAVGAAYPWSGAEPYGPILRVKAYKPTSYDFLYVSMGTNDFVYGLTADQTAANLSWMIDEWLNVGGAASHFILTTLAPRAGSGVIIPAINNLIRSIASSRGVFLVDIASRTSDDNGLTWRDPADNVGDSIHYSEPVRDWIASQVVPYMLSLTPK